MGKSSEDSSWLIIREPIIRNLFFLIFTLGLTAGMLRFLFPFQLLKVGGTEPLISWEHQHRYLLRMVNII